MQLDQVCPIWGTPATVQQGTGDYLAVFSPRTCGAYRITGTAIRELQHITPRIRAKLTTWLLDERRGGESSPKITSDVITTVTHRPDIAIADRLDRALRALMIKTTSVGKDIPFFGRQDATTTENQELVQAWTESQDLAEAAAVLRFLDEAGLTRPTTSGRIISFEGLKRIEDLDKAASLSSQAFAAMWFDESVREAFTHGIDPAIRACGYQPIRIDNKEHIGKIDDEIISEIRRSRFVVADFTSAPGAPRGGVYFEAGFAMGLGIPVIWACRQDIIAEVHFDTRQFNHIVWDTPEDLRDKLRKRIGAVIGDGPLPKASDR